MLRQARTTDLPTLDALWRAPENAAWIEPPEDGEIEAALDKGLAYLWQAPNQPVDQPPGMAVMMTWVPRVMGLSAITCPPGQGKPFFRALLAQVFGPQTLGGLNAHRIGFDVTADNARAIRLYESFGFTREGHIRECWQRPSGDWVDCYLYGLLAKEWTA